MVMGRWMQKMMQQRVTMHEGDHLQFGGGALVPAQPWGLQQGSWLVADAFGLLESSSMFSETSSKAQGLLEVL